MRVVRRLHVFTGAEKSVLVSTDNGCPACGAEVRTAEFEWEVSGLPVSEETSCSKCDWQQGWDPEHEWSTLTPAYE